MTLGALRIKQFSKPNYMIEWVNSKINQLGSFLLWCAIFFFDEFDEEISDWIHWLIQLIAHESHKRSTKLKNYVFFSFRRSINQK